MILNDLKSYLILRTNYTYVHDISITITIGQKFYQNRLINEWVRKNFAKWALSDHS